MDLDWDLDLRIVDLDLHLNLAVAGLVTSLISATITIITTLQYSDEGIPYSFWPTSEVQP